MKLAITATGPDISASADPRFGRCAYFIVINETSQEWKALRNPATEAGGGAGTQAAQFIANLGVQAVISGKFGPNAYAALQAAGIQMYEGQNGDVNALNEAFLAGHLKSVKAPTHSGKHGGRGR